MCFDAFSSKNGYETTFTNDYGQGCFIVFECRSFTGKERDEETGFGYFGARYMDHELMTMWLSVDPLADKYPNISPYAYCAWNPIKFVDPDGEEIGDFYDEYGNYLGSDGINDCMVYQTTNEAWNRHIKNSTAPENSGAAGIVPSKYDNLKLDSETHCLGQTNEFGLLQLTKMGNPNIVNNDDCEDTYSYTTQSGGKSMEAQHGDDWTSPSIAAAFNYAVNQTGVTVVVNDVSAYDGVTNLGHKSHRNGMCIDFRYITENGLGSSVYSTLTYNQCTLNNTFLDALHTAGFRSIAGGSKISSTLVDAKIHNNHIHVDRKY